MRFRAHHASASDSRRCPRTGSRSEIPRILPQVLLIFPIFLFQGVFFPVQQLPPMFQNIVGILLLTLLALMIRSFVLGLPIFWPAKPIWCSQDSGAGLTVAGCEPVW